MSSPLPPCPLCSSDQFVAKVSRIVEGDLIDFSKVSIHTLDQVRKISYRQLQARFSFPAHSRRLRTSRSLFDLPDRYLLLLIGLAGEAICFIAFFYTPAVNYNPLAFQQSPMASHTYLVVVSIFFVLFSIPVFLAASMGEKNQTFPRKINLEKVRLAQIAKERNRALDTKEADRHARWAKLYYCYRDDTVFDPSIAGRYTPSSALRSLIDP